VYTALPSPARFARPHRANSASPSPQARPRRRRPAVSAALAPLLLALAACGYGS
jgi:hypothetical protein